jgi:hypothetical protein
VHYSFEAQVLTSHVIGAPLEIDVGLMNGIINAIEVYFPKGCARTIRACFFDSVGQVAPVAASSFYSLDGGQVIFPIYYVNATGANSLHFRGWTIGSSYNHTLTVHVECKPVDSPDGGN